MDSMQRFGASFRAVRIKRGWRQIDVAARAHVDRSVVSAIERGHLESISIGTLLRIARVLEIQVTWSTRWKAGDLDRLLAGRHARLHEAVARWFVTSLPDWVLAPEVSFSIFGERGVIDILAWHPARRALLVIELKTDIVDVNQLIGSMDQRRRLAWQIARNRGWDPLTVSTWVLVAGGRTNRARLAAHRTVLRKRIPNRRSRHRGLAATAESLYRCAVRTGSAGREDRDDRHVRPASGAPPRSGAAAPS